MWGTTGDRRGGRRETEWGGGTCGPDTQRDRRWAGSGLCFGGTCFGSFSELAPPWVSRAAQITMGGIREGQGDRTDWHIYDRCLF